MGLGGSTSKRMKNVNAIAYNNHKASFPVHDLQLTFHISSLVRITAVIIHQLIAHESEHPDKSTFPYYDKKHAYSTLAAFIDRNIFEAYFSEVVFSDIIKIQSKLRSKAESTLILYNRLGDHISPHIFPNLLQLTLLLYHVIFLIDCNGSMDIFQIFEFIYSHVPKSPNPKY